MATNMAEVLKLAARPTPYHKDERTWLMVRFKLEKYLTLVNERYVQLCRTQNLNLWRMFQREPTGDLCSSER